MLSISRKGKQVLRFVRGFIKRHVIDNEDPYMLGAGSHDTPEEGRCAMEWVSWLEGTKHSDTPKTVDSALIYFVSGLNDALDDLHRQRLRPYLSQMVGTKNDGHRNYRRERILSYKKVLGIQSRDFRGIADRLYILLGEEEMFKILNELLPGHKLRLDYVDPHKQKVARKVFA